MRVTAIIPARGGSRGVPLKNIRLLGGVPLLAHAIRAARAAAQVDEVCVSTDSDLIAETALLYGAQVLRRPPELSRDETSSEAVLLEALQQLTDQGRAPELVVFLQCTAPALTAADIDATISCLLRSGSQSAFAAAPFHHFVWEQGEQGARGLNHDGRSRLRRQDLPPQYLEAGSVYVMDAAAFRQERTRFCGRTAIHVLEEAERVLEIDSACDFYLAQALMRWLAKSGEEREQFRVRQTDIERRLRGIRAAVFDFDGVFTDGGVYVDQSGREQVRCSRSDGQGLALLRGHTPLRLLVLTAESSPCAAQRCAKLQLPVISGCADKAQALQAWAGEQGLELGEILYCGDDVGDLPLLHRVGLFMAPANAQARIRDEADFVSARRGGDGFVRQVCELLLSCQAQLQAGCSYRPLETEQRPWGSWQVIETLHHQCLKRLTLHPRAQLSYQVHEFRDEIWVCISGRGRVVIDGREQLLESGGSVRVARGCCHRLHNLSSEQELVLYEIQLGELLDEDDIIRFADDYGRT